jgi:hypothetical protein
LNAETQALLTNQGWNIRWDRATQRYIINQRAFDEASQSFHPYRIDHQIGYIDIEGNLHINILRPSFREVRQTQQENNPEEGNVQTRTQTSFEDNSTIGQLTLPLRTFSLQQNQENYFPLPTPVIDDDLQFTPTPTSEIQEETQPIASLGFSLVPTDNPNPIFQQTGGILVFRYYDENGVLHSATYSQNRGAFFDFDLSTVEANRYVWAIESDVLQERLTLTYIPWDILHDPRLPVTASLIDSGFDRPFPEVTQNNLLGYILRFEMAEDGSKVCYLRPAIDPHLVTDEFVNDPARWAARTDEHGNWERPFFVTVDPNGNKILFTYMQLLDINGNRLFLPLAIGANIPDERIPLVIRDFNLAFARTGSPTFDRIIIATQGYPLRVLPPTHIFYESMGAEGRAPLDSLLEMEGNDVRNIDYVNHETDGWYAYFPIELQTFMPLLKDNPVQETNPFQAQLTPSLQQVVSVIDR